MRDDVAIEGIVEWPRGVLSSQFRVIFSDYHRTMNADHAAMRVSEKNYASFNTMKNVFGVTLICYILGMRANVHLNSVGNRRSPSHNRCAALAHAPHTRDAHVLRQRRCSTPRAAHHHSPRRSPPPRAYNRIPRGTTCRAPRPALHPPGPADLLRSVPSPQ